jgi:aryl-alcohol dehydrogenase-like predicted oxidoreductase
MRQIVLPGTALTVSRLSFGTASLHHIGSARDRCNLIAAAVEAGFTHFDTAPYYGFGMAEEALGRSLAGRAGVTVATKIGLYPPRGARPHLASVWLRKLAGRIVPSLSHPRADWSIAAAAASVEASLRRLRRERLDLLLLHEPSADLIDSGAYTEWLQRERDRGTIDAYGLAGPVQRVAPWADQALGAVLQVRDSLHAREADALLERGRPLQFTYGYLSRRAADARLPAAEALRGALHRNTTGSILVSTRSRHHLEDLAGVGHAEDGCDH